MQISDEQLPTVTVRLPMTENPKLTLEVLRYLAHDDVPFPANIELKDLEARFSDESKDALVCSIVRAYDAGLLVGDGYKLNSMRSFATNYTISVIYGLSSDGESYYVQATDERFERACAMVKELGQDIDTINIRAAMDTLMMNDMDAASASASDT